MFSFSTTSLQIELDEREREREGSGELVDVCVKQECTMLSHLLKSPLLSYLQQGFPLHLVCSCWLINTLVILFQLYNEFCDCYFAYDEQNNFQGQLPTVL